MAGNPSALPLNFLINLDVLNPNTKALSIQELEYILRVDNVELTRGTFKKTFKLPAQRTRSVPLPVSIDIASLLRTSSAGAIQNMIKNFMGTGTRSTNVTLQIKPTYKAGKQILPESRYIPVSFSFQVKK